MSQNESQTPPKAGEAGRTSDSSDTTPGRAMEGYGLAMKAFFDRHPSLRRHKWFIAVSVAPLFALGVFVATHRADASAEDEVSCSSYAAVQLVGDILKEHVFASEAKDMLDPDRFGGKLVGIATASSKPLVCTASFVPTLALSRAALADAAAAGTAKSVLDEIHGNAVDKYSARLKYKVRDNGSGKLYVEVIEGLDAFDD